MREIRRNHVVAKQIVAKLDLQKNNSDGKTGVSRLETVAKKTRGRHIIQAEKKKQRFDAWYNRLIVKIFFIN